MAEGRGTTEINNVNPENLLGELHLSNAESVKITIKAITERGVPADTISDLIKLAEKISRVPGGLGGQVQTSSGEWQTPISPDHFFQFFQGASMAADKTPLDQALKAVLKTTVPNEINQSPTKLQATELAGYFLAQTRLQPASTK